MVCQIVRVEGQKEFVKISNNGCTTATTVVITSCLIGSSASTVDETGQDIEEYPSGEAITAFQPVVLNNGQLFVADNTDDNHTGKFIGLALISAASAGINVNVARSGLVTNGGWSFTTGSFIFIGANGLLVQSAPATGFLQSIGHALNGNNLVLNIKQAIRRI